MRVVTDIILQQKPHGGETERRKEQQAGMPPVASPACSLSGKQIAQKPADRRLKSGRRPSGKSANLPSDVRQAAS
ncbi:Uncharacterised protein [Prevotella denticola]|uniref:Uncharacterized protein n=1 Tax=Prevotella denticola TaxID=28129 RepID=A0A379ECL8_9BACT|nr:Uncharacterised protein [Prevotella denticola]